MLLFCCSSPSLPLSYLLCLIVARCLSLSTAWRSTPIGSQLNVAGNLCTAASVAGSCRCGWLSWLAVGVVRMMIQMRVGRAIRGKERVCETATGARERVGWGRSLMYVEIRAEKGFRAPRQHRCAGYRRDCTSTARFNEPTRQPY